LAGAELLETSRITLPVPEPWLSWIRELRTGGHTMQEALDVAAEFEDRITRLTATSPLPEHPNRATADEWLIYAYEEAWNGWAVRAGGGGQEG
jgi:hypothetical protein